MYKISLDIREVHLGRFDNGIESHCHIDTLLTAEVKRIISVSYTHLTYNQSFQI